MCHTLLLARRVKILLERGVLLVLDCHLELFPSEVDLNLGVFFLLRLLLLDRVKVAVGVLQRLGCSLACLGLGPLGSLLQLS